MKKQLIGVCLGFDNDVLACSILNEFSLKQVSNLKILVLGATGFIGRAVVKNLASRGQSLIFAASRTINTSDISELEFVERICCDVFDPQSLQEATRQADVVVNCFRETTTEKDAVVTIGNLLDACARNNVRRLIHISSTAVYGEATGIVDENSPAREPLNWYARAKMAAERACEEKASETFRVAVLRPSLVYGPNGEEWSLDFIRSVNRGHLLGLGAAGDGTANLVYVDDLADFCAQLTTAEIPMFSILNVNGSAGTTFNEYFAEIGKELARTLYEGRKPSPTILNLRHARRLVRGLLKGQHRLLGPLVARSPGLSGLIASAEIAARARPEEGPPANFSRQVFYSPERAMLMGFTPTTSVEEGVRRSVDWAKSGALV